ncbi:MAG: DUF2007 domain-containing protein [Bacteroides sp.]|nr:DUF2007 domain-containing protein [Bacteroides sp.]
MKITEQLNLVKVFTGTPWEAEIVKGLLESAGIHAVVDDESLESLSPYINQNTTVWVDPQDEGIALELIWRREN